MIIKNRASAQNVKKRSGHFAPILMTPIFILFARYGGHVSQFICG
jgi:hypothetical protein